MKSAGKRAYSSAVRSARAAATRQRITSAATKLFAKHGIDAVSIEELASEAAVAPVTIYSLFKSKAGVVKALVEATFFGDFYRQLAERTRRVSDPFELLRITASISRTIFDRERAEMGLIRGASALSPELKRVEEEFDRIRFELQKARAVLFLRRRIARQGLNLRKVRDIMWMLTGRDIYQMLVLQRGWSPDEYESWLADALIGALLEPQGPEDRPR
jgi:AcrR family transcriptional regulator